MTSIDKGVQVIKCVSHGCELWTGRHLTDEEIQAISRGHAIQHSNTPITVARMFGDETETEE